MKKELNKSEIIRLGIQLVDELTVEELIERLNKIKVERVIPKNKITMYIDNI